MAHCWSGLGQALVKFSLSVSDGGFSKPPKALIMLLDPLHVTSPQKYEHRDLNMVLGLLNIDLCNVGQAKLLRLLDFGLLGGLVTGLQHSLCPVDDNELVCRFMLRAWVSSVMNAHFPKWTAIDSAISKPSLPSLLPALPCLQ